MPEQQQSFEQQNELFPRDPSYSYGNVLPFRVPLGPTGQQAGPAEWDPLSYGLVGNTLNSAYRALMLPQRSALGQVTPTPANATEAAMTLLGSGLAAAPGGASTMGVIRGYHGTPHTFEPVEHNPFGEFVDSAIGSGEGAQVYGWGHYIAGHPETAKTYAQTRGQLTIHGTRDIDPGNVLRVEIKPGEEDLLDWDLPVQKQAPGVQGKIKKLLPEGLVGGNDTGEDFYHSLAKMNGNFGTEWQAGTYNDQAASEALHRAGIPGIRYLDQGSRAAKPELHFEGAPAKQALPGAYEQQSPDGHWKDILDYNPAETAQLFMLNGHDSTAIPIEQNIQETLKDLKFNIQETKDMLNPKHGNYTPDLDPRVLPHYQAAYDWLSANKDKYHVKTPPQTRNYVIFHPSNLKITGRNGERLEPVEGDPFTGQAKYKIVPIDHDPFGGSK